MNTVLGAIRKRKNVSIVYRRLFGFVAATVAVVVLAGTSSGDAWAGGAATCSGGSIASGVYSNLNIAGICIVDAGPVTVEHNLTVLPGGSLIAVFGGSDITVGGNLDVQTSGLVVLGCEPVHFPCVNGPDQLTTDRVGGNLTAEDALAVVVHVTTIGRNVSLSGGGGGVSCASSLPTLGGNPPYGDFEDDTIGNNLNITGWQSCWLGFFRDTIAHNVNFNDNVTADPDGNEIASNSITGNLNCTGNSPSPQIGDSMGSLSTVFGRANGQCANPLLVQH